MKLVVDANIVMSALIALEGITRKLLFLDDLELASPDFLLKEIARHKKEILMKSGLEETDFEKAISLIMTRIAIVSKQQYSKQIKKSQKFCPDPYDTEYFALALNLDCPIWSDDKALKKQDCIRIISTAELVKECSVS